MDPDCKRIAHSPGPLLLMTRRPTVPHLPRRVRRSNALRRPRSTCQRTLSAASGDLTPCAAPDRLCRGSYPRALPAVPHLPRRVRSASALYRTRSACQRTLSAASVDLTPCAARDRHRRGSYPRALPAAPHLPRRVRSASALYRTRSTCQRTLSAPPNQRAVCVQRSSIRSRSATRSAKASALCSGARRMAAGW